MQLKLTWPRLRAYNITVAAWPFFDAGFLCLTDSDVSHNLLRKVLSLGYVNKHIKELKFLPIL